MVSRKAFWEKLQSYHIGTAVIAVILSVGLNSMQASAASLYPNIESPNMTSANIFDANKVVTYGFYEYAQYMPGPVDCSIEACVALTFDDGPNQLTTPRVLDALEQAHAQATFFVIGSRAQIHPDLLQRMRINGDEVGNHSWSHPDFTKLTADQIKQQITLTQSVVVAAGLPAPRYFRPPYEDRNALVHQMVNMPFILWNVDSKDWAQKTIDDIVNNTIGSIKPGSMVILHDTLDLTAQALPQILEKLKGQYHFVTVSQLADAPLDSQSEYFGHYLPN